MLTSALPAILGALCIGDVPTTWSLELQCRSSLNPGVPPFNLPFPSSLSSQYVALGEDGSVAIRYVTAGSATEGIFFGQGGAGGTIYAVNNPADPVFSTDIDLRAGRLALSYLTTGTGAIVLDIAGTLLQAYPAGGTQGVSNFSGVQLTTDGALGYRGDSGPNKKFVLDEFAGMTRTQTLVAQTGTGLYTFLFAPSLNDARQVASKVFDAASNSLVYRFEPGGARTLIADARAGAPFNSILNGVALGAAGDVACFARDRATNEWRLVRGDGASTQVIARPGDLDIVVSEFGNFGPDVNGEGWVVFRAKTSTGHAVFVGDGENLVRIAGDGDLVETDLGPVALGLDFGPPTGRQTLSGRVVINDAGQIAFAAFLEYDSIGVFVATPVFPCPADLSASSDPNDPGYGTPDGLTDAADFFYFLDQFVGMNLAVADLTGSSDPNDAGYGVPDGLIDTADFFYYLDRFVEGCP